MPRVQRVGIQSQGKIIVLASVRRLGQPMELEALRRFIINVDVEVVPQYMSDLFTLFTPWNSKTSSPTTAAQFGPSAHLPKHAWGWTSTGCFAMDRGAPNTRAACRSRHHLFEQTKSVFFF